MKPEISEKQKLKSEIENCIISTLLNSPEKIIGFNERISRDHFSGDNRELFQKINELLGVCELDSNSLIIELTKEKTGDLVSLMKLKSESIYSFDQLITREYFEKLIDLDYSIKIEKILREKLSKAEKDFTGLDTLYNIQSETEKLIMDHSKHKQQIEKFSELLEKELIVIDLELQNKNENLFKLKSIPSFNTATSGGIRFGNLVSILGSYKSGKTTLSMNMILDFAKQKIPCGYFNLEMSESEVTRKLLGIHSGIDYDKMKNVKLLGGSDIKQIFLSNKIKIPLLVSNLTTDFNEIVNKIKLWKRKYGVKIIAIDHLQRITSNRKSETREQEISFYSNSFKRIALQENICLIIGSQLNRTGKNSPNSENISESLALNRDSDFGFIIFKPSETDKRKFNDSDYYLKLDLSRHSKAGGVIHLKMSDSGMFRELATQYETNYQEVI